MTYERYLHYTRHLNKPDNRRSLPPVRSSELITFHGQVKDFLSTSLEMYPRMPSATTYCPNGIRGTTISLINIVREEAEAAYEMACLGNCNIFSFLVKMPLYKTVKTRTYMEQVITDEYLISYCLK